MAKIVPKQTVMLTAGLLLGAGFETTSSLVAVTLYLLQRNSHCLERVTNEIRSSFKSQNDISFAAVDNLPYMVACLNEALRWYPPVASGMPRQVMKGGTSIAGEFVPESVCSDVLTSCCPRQLLNLHRRLSLYTTGESTTPPPTLSSPTSIIRSAGLGIRGSPQTSSILFSRLWLAHGTALAKSESKTEPLSANPSRKAKELAITDSLDDPAWRLLRCAPFSHYCCITLTSRCPPSISVGLRSKGSTIFGTEGLSKCTSPLFRGDASPQTLGSARQA